MWRPTPQDGRLTLIKVEPRERKPILRGRPVPSFCAEAMLPCRDGAAGNLTAVRLSMSGQSRMIGDEKCVWVAYQQIENFACR